MAFGVAILLPVRLVNDGSCYEPAGAALTAGGGRGGPQAKLDKMMAEWGFKDRATAEAAFRAQAHQQQHQRAGRLRNDLQVGCLPSAFAMLLTCCSPTCLVCRTIRGRDSSVLPEPSASAFAVCGLPFAICGPSIAMRGLPFAMWSLLFAISGVPFAICALPPTMRGLPNAMRGLSLYVGPPFGHVWPTFCHACASAISVLPFAMWSLCLSCGTYEPRPRRPLGRGSNHLELFLQKPPLIILLRAEFIWVCGTWRACRILSFGSPASGSRWRRRW